ncbi:VanZ family protein [Lysinibacillus odysseyi]|uniref:VanZ family protein n=1 Tax=Lysinibacillus odysseyi TaxID=202611 RepID=UPI0009DDD4A8|nr:VanZ family protein [Lysinibacillus odysseyi]
MIEQFLQSTAAYCIILTPVYVIARFLWLKNKKKSFIREIVMLLFFFYSVSIFSQTIIPQFWIENGHIKVATHTYRSNNLVPFATISAYTELLQGPLVRIAFYNLAGNVVLFIPFGFFIPLVWRFFRKWGKMIIVSLAIPLFIEGIQYFIGRSTDIDDVILNALAILIGYLLYLILAWFSKFMKNEQKRL